MHGSLDTPDELNTLRRRLERERAARVQAEEIAERGLRELFARQEEIKLLQRVAAAANTTSVIGEALAFALREICRFSGWKIGHAFICDQKSTELSFANLWHSELPGAEVFKEACRSVVLTPGVGLPGRVLSTRRSVWIEDVSVDTNFLRSRSAAVCGLRAAFGFPVLVGTEIVAVMEFFSLAAQERDPAILEIMEQIGLQLGRVVERRRSEDRLLYEATHDALTGLANRALFQDRLARAAERHQAKPDDIYAVLFVDLDKFKLINDSLGHEAGDDILKATAKRISAALSPFAGYGLFTLARLGGDEFVVLMEQIESETAPVRIAESIKAAIDMPYEKLGQNIRLAASIGIAIAGAEPRTAPEMLQNADIAMYRAKSGGHKRIEVFDMEMHTAAVTRLALESDLRNAIDAEDFFLVYQPIISLTSAKIVGFEALVRWRRSSGVLVPPAEFIPIAEETGLIVHLGEWVLRQACKTVAEWSTTAPIPNNFTLSINISPRHFSQPDFVANTKRVVREAGIDPSLIRLELTESVTIDDAERTISVLNELRECGMSIAIDDFGTGYSSLSYLQRLPLDILKIDRSFIASMGDDAGGRNIVKTIMSLARTLGMDVVAEGAETARQVFELQEMGCRFCQGYFFSKPLELEAATEMLHNGIGSARRKHA